MPCVRRPPTPSFSFPTPTSSPYIIIPNGIPHNTIPLTATQPHTILTHTTPQHHPPYTIPHTPPPSCPWSHTIYPTPSAPTDGASAQGTEEPHPRPHPDLHTQAASGLPAMATPLLRSSPQGGPKV